MAPSPSLSLSPALALVATPIATRRVSVSVTASLDVYSDSRAGFPICILRTSCCQQITHVNTSKAQGESQQQGESRTDTETGQPERERKV